MFEWPCDKREAHGRHLIKEHGFAREPWECPGVGAYPTTMIGGAYREDEV